MKRYYLAIDIGASSGRHIVGWREDGEIKAKEVYRFPNGVQEQNGHLVWDVDALLSHVKAGIAAAKAEFPEIVSLSVDTWAVDYVLLRGEEEVRPVYAYRDSRTEAAIPKVHEILPFAELYAKTGCQFQPFNSIYQLYADQLAGRLEGVTDFLMIPEYLLWKLCGVKSKELALRAAKALDDRKGLKIRLLQVTDVTSIADYFLICTGTSNTHVKTLCDSVEAAVSDELGEPLLHREGHRGGTWVLLDFGCLVVHVFTEETRAFYDLERLWNDATPVPIDFAE